MRNDNPLNYAAPPTPKPPNWTLVLLPLFLAAGPIVVASIGFSMGFGGMALSALALLSGFLLSPAAALLSIINLARYYRNTAALALSASILLFSIAALAYELWRLNGQWD